MANLKRVPPCPDCGCPNRDVGTVPGRYWANDHEIPCWAIKCGNCAKTYHAGMFVLPEGASQSSLDEERRKWYRDWARKKRGFHHQEHKGHRLTSDRLMATVTLLTGSRESGLALRMPLPARRTRRTT